MIKFDTNFIGDKIVIKEKYSEDKENKYVNGDANSNFYNSTLNIDSGLNFTQNVHDSQIFLII